MTNLILTYIILSLSCYQQDRLSPVPGSDHEIDTIGHDAEWISICADRKLYISGETVWFRLFVFDSTSGTVSDLSKLAYVELIRRDGAVVSRVKMGLQNGYGSGAVGIPQALDNGDYFLRAYTRHMRNQGASSFAKWPIIVLHPEQPIVTSNHDSGDLLNTAIEQLERPTDRQQVQIDITSSNDILKQREKATFIVRTTDENGDPIVADIVISVVMSDSSSHLGLDGHEDRLPGEESIADGASVMSYVPESNGMILEGRVVDDITGEGSSGSRIYLSLPGDRALVYSALTDARGDFSFVLPKLYGPRQVILQVDPKHDLGLSIELEDDFHDVTPGASRLFTLPSSMLSLANGMLTNAQIGRSYEAFSEPPSYVVDNHYDRVPFFGSPDVFYKLDDYERFPLAEFFFEVVPEIRARGKVDNMRLKVTNEWEIPDREIPPLLLVDGVPIFDQSKFLKINNRVIEAVEVVMEPFWLNTIIYDGIIQMKSYDADARCFDWPESALVSDYLMLQPHRRFTMPDYSQKIGSRLPDFRTTLYWNPRIRTDRQGEAVVSFYTSDAIATYNISVQAVTPSGNIATTTRSLIVTGVD